MGVRKPIVAGQFYEKDFQKLNKQIEECFEGKNGPGALPLKKRQGDVLGAIVPHAGYVFSGPCAAWCYKEIAESKFSDLFLILGPNHSGFGSTSTILDDWETPFGVVKVDKSFAKKLVENSSIKEDSMAHLNEHSIEVQLPFLQFASRDNLDNLRFVAITLSYDFNLNELASSIRKTIDESGKKVCVIASSDFTHYGSAYGYMPFSQNIKENMKKLDYGAIDFIKKLDSKGFLNYVKEKKATICGTSAISLLIEVLKGRANKANLMHYYTSGDVMGDYSNAVGYAGIIFK
ncbi:MAG: AmmeMemoRadiSam system protein B [Candidatus Nanoarchaeia archaeon]|nr:AmmeMemoRadiSam system protein B [Candidatus Nanoarchaeia archaeon]